MDSQKRARVGDADIVVVYIAGGLSPGDIKAAARAKERCHNTMRATSFQQVLIGGSSLLGTARSVSSVLAATRD